mgnify:FL=1
MLEIKNVEQYYGESHTLWDLSLTIPKGECTVLMGRNGVGKSTLLECIMGLTPIRSGEIELNGESIAHRSAEDRPRLGIGYVPQGRQIFPMLSVEENLSVGLPIRDKSDRKIPSFIYEIFPVLE